MAIPPPATSSYVFLVSLCVLATKVMAARRRYDDLLTSLQSEVESLKEENQLLHGEVRDLMGVVENLARSVDGLSGLVAQTLPQDCSQARARGSWAAVAMVAPPGLEPREVPCDQLTDGGGWTVIVGRRPLDTPHRHDPRFGRMDFNKTWAEYREGFGDPRGEFWLGNEVLHALTRDVAHQLHVLLTDWEGNTASATWDHFRVGSEAQKFRLSVMDYRPDSTAGDGLRHHNNQKFSAHDRENDIHLDDHCAQKFGGGWWYFQCYESHLTGEPMRRGEDGQHGIVWLPWQDTRGLKAATMMMRPRPKPCKLGQVCWGW